MTAPDPAALRRAETLPASWYVSAERYEAERRAVFAREWQLVGHESELARPGDAIAECLAGWPLFVRRGRDGVLRGFHNVCRHRAGPLVWEPEAAEAAGGLAQASQRVPRLRCLYHGWLYDEEGRLERAPDFGDAEAFDPGAIRLEPVRVETWRGFVFVSLSAGAPPLRDALGRLPDLARELDLESCRLVGRASHPIRCNWKTYVENYLEGYHVPYLHPALHREVDAKAYRVEAEARCVTHHVPLRPSASGPVYEGLWAWLVPNLAFNVYGSGLSVERMLPTGPRSMRIEYLFLFRERADVEAALAMCRQVTAEDRRVCEAVQRNLEAGVYDRGRLSPRHENGVFYFQAWLRGALAEGPVTGSAPGPPAGRG